MLFWLPGVAYAVVTAVREGSPSPLGLAALVASGLAGYWAVNRFGLYQNRQMMEETRAALARAGSPPPAEAEFVGLSRPGDSLWLDPHSDVGFLWSDSRALHFASAVRRLELPREAVTAVRRRANIHSALGLGGFVAVDAGKNGWLVELRTESTLMGNRRRLPALKSKLEQWRNLPPSPRTLPS